MKGPAIKVKMDELRAQLQPLGVPVIFAIIFAIEKLGVFHLGTLRLSILLYALLAAIALRQYANLSLSEVGDAGLLTIPSIGLRYAQITLGAVMAVMAGFSEIARNLSVTFGGFTAAPDNFWIWLRYGLSWMLDNVLFNASQVLNWEISPIHPAAVWSKIMVIGYNVLLDVLVITIIVRYIQAFRRSFQHDLTWSREYNREHGRNESSLAHVIQPKGVYWLFEYVRYLAWYTLLGALYVLPTLAVVSGLVRDELTIVSAWAFIQVSGLPVLGIWLIVQGIRACCDISRHIRRAGLVEIVAGAALLYFTVPGLIAYLAH